MSTMLGYQKWCYDLTEKLATKTTENRLLRETVEELYEIMENIDFSTQEMYKYDDMPWEKWEAVLDKQPIQLELFK